jgi:magnesium-transporting ATPase (P-type)
MKYAWTSPYHPIQIPIGLIIWSLWFVAMYGGQAVICKLSPPDPAQGVWNWLNGSLGVLTLLTLGLLLWMARYFWRLSHMPEQLNERQQFVTKIAAGIHLIAALATLFVGIPLLQIPPCL